MLGRYLKSGVASEPNPAKAREWLERAVAQGVADAQQDLAELSPLLPQSEAELVWYAKAARRKGAKATEKK